MATKPYQEILQRAQAELSAEEQNQLSAELAQSVARDRNGKRRSLLELEGLGKDPTSISPRSVTHGMARRPARSSRRSRLRTSHLLH